MPSPLDEHRAVIDRLNHELLTLLNQRLAVAEQIRETKATAATPLRDPAREDEMLDDLLAANAGPASDDAVRRLFSTIFELSLEHMRRH